MSRAAICCCDLLRFSSRSSDLGVVKYRDKNFLCQENFPPFEHNFLFCYVKIPPNFPSHISTLPISQKKTTPHNNCDNGSLLGEISPFYFSLPKNPPIHLKTCQQFPFFFLGEILGKTKCCVFCCEKNACDSIFLTKKNTEKIHQKMRKIECQKYHFLSLQKKKTNFSKVFLSQAKSNWVTNCLQRYYRNGNFPMFIWENKLENPTIIDLNFSKWTLFGIWGLFLFSVPHNSQNLSKNRNFQTDHLTTNQKGDIPKKSPTNKDIMTEISWHPNSKLSWTCFFGGLCVFESRVKIIDVSKIEEIYAARSHWVWLWLCFKFEVVNLNSFWDIHKTNWFGNNFFWG